MKITGLTKLQGNKNLEVELSVIKTGITSAMQEKCRVKVGETAFFGGTVFPQSSFIPHEIEASVRPDGTSVHTTMCCIKGVL